MNKYLWHFSAFPAFFVLFWIETIHIGGIKIAILWKILFFSYLLIYLSVYILRIRMEKFIFYGFLYSLKNFITLSSVQYFIASLVEMVKTSFIPLLTYFFIVISRNKRLDLYKLIVTLSIYIILSSIPFLLGLVEPFSKGYDLSIFGVDSRGFVGIFQNAHGAAITMAFALAVIFFEFQKTNTKKLFYLFLILLGLWVEIQTYVRTGFVMIVILGGYAFLIKKRFSYYLKLIPFLILFGFSFWQYYLSSAVLQMRIEGTNIHVIQAAKEVGLGSGRLKFMDAAITNWSNNGPASIIVGLGIGMAKDLMEESVGMRIYAHNGFIDVLQFNGLLGSLLYLFFIYFIYRYIKKNKESQYIELGRLLTIAYLVSMLFQGEHYFLADVLFVLSLAIISNNNLVLRKKD